MSTFVDFSGNIFNSEADAIVVTVNCVGFMGKGMALECALRFPDVERQYKADCSAGKVIVGKLNWIKLDSGKFLILFPTKTDYKFPSKTEYIKAGLNGLLSDLGVFNIGSIAIPRLGSELGGLNWDNVRPLIVDSLENSSLQIEMWSFSNSENDPLMLMLNQQLLDSPSEVSRAIKVSINQISTISSFLDRNHGASAVDLLSVPGVGKTTVKKLINFARKSQSLSELTLFD